MPKLETTFWLDGITKAATGAATDADSTPTCEVFEEDTDTAIHTPTMVKRTGKTGNYRVGIVATAANGFESQKSYNAVMSYTMSGIACKEVLCSFLMKTGDVDAVNVAKWNSLATVALPLVPTTAGRALDVSATGEAGLDFDNVKDASSAHTLTNITVPTVSTLTGHTPQTGDSYGRIGTNGAGLTALGDTRIANLDAAVTSRSSHSAADVWAVGTRTLTGFGTLVADIATAVWGAASRTLSAFGFTVALDSTQTQAAAAAALTAYGPPTRTEATDDKDEIIAAIGNIEIPSAPTVEEIRDGILSDSTPFNGADIAAIRAKTVLIGTARATVQAPVTAEGNALIDQGSDYKVADGTALTFAITGGTVESVRDNIDGLAFIIGNPATLSVEADWDPFDDDELGTGITATVELTREQTTALGICSNTYFIKATLNNTDVTPVLMTGNFSVRKAGL